MLSGTVEAYNAVNDSRTGKTAMPSACWDAASGVINGNIYVVKARGSVRRSLLIVSAAWEVYAPSPDT